MTRHELATEGAWVELRPVDELRNRHRKQLLDILMPNIVIGPDGNHMPIPRMKAYMAGRDGAEVVSAALVTAWYLPYMPEAVLPSQDLDILNELKIPDADALNKLVLPALQVLSPRATTPDDHAEENSPSVPAST